MVLEKYPAIHDRRKIRITNERLWDIAQEGHDLDQWLIDNIGYGNWTEWLGVSNLPYRSFSFKHEEHETLFILKWL